MATDPMTAREALLEIRRFLASGDLLANANGSALDQIAEAGLSRTAPINFELSDQLADRLAEAHSLLRGVVEAVEQGVAKGNDPFSAEFKAKFYEALALPPDLEAMVERRIGSEPPTGVGGSS